MGVMTALGVIWPEMKLRLDTFGVVPHGYTATQPPSLPTEVLAAVTLRDTAPIELAVVGSPPFPSTSKESTVPASSFPLPTLPGVTPPVPSRVSMMRDGVTVVNAVSLRLNSIVGAEKVICGSSTNAPPSSRVMVGERIVSISSSIFFTERYAAISSSVNGMRHCSRRATGK